MYSRFPVVFHGIPVDVRDTAAHELSRAFVMLLKLDPAGGVVSVFDAKASTWRGLTHVDAADLTERLPVDWLAGYLAGRVAGFYRLHIGGVLEVEAEWNGERLLTVDDLEYGGIG